MNAIIPHPSGPGRPLVQINLSRVRELAALGLTVEQIADRIGVCRRTLFSRMSTDPAIRGAMDEGLAEATEFAARTLFDMAREKNLGALIFWLKTKGRFNTPREPAPTPSVVVNVGSEPAPVNLEGGLEDGREIKGASSETPSRRRSRTPEGAIDTYAAIALDGAISPASTSIVSSASASRCSAAATCGR